MKKANMTFEQMDHALVAIHLAVRALLAEKKRPTASAVRKLALDYGLHITEPLFIDQAMTAFNWNQFSKLRAHEESPRRHC